MPKKDDKYPEHQADPHPIDQADPNRPIKGKLEEGAIEETDVTGTHYNERSRENPVGRKEEGRDSPLL